MVPVVPVAPDYTYGYSVENLEAIEDPEVARVAAQGEYLMEVFPALALASYSPAFGYRKGPRYNPDRKTFRIEDWIATIDAAINEATRFSCLQLVAWLTGLRTNLAPRKVDQDRLDSALCLLVAMRWRLSSARNVCFHRRLEDRIHGSASLPAGNATT